MDFFPRRGALLLVALFVLPTTLLTAETDWRQFGGPNRDFSVPEDPGLATDWGTAGPKALWRLTLGDHGHSAVVVDGSTLYTTYRRGDQDVLVAASIETGRRLWEKAYDAPVPENHNHQFGPGPHSTPLVAGDRVFAVSAGTELRSFDKNDGELLWQRDLMKEEEVSFMHRGYGASPLAWGDLLIVNGGGNGQGVVALDQATGKTVWKSLDGDGSYASPLMLTLDGVEQLVVTLGPKRAGLDPSDGRVLWQLDLPESAMTTMATPVQVGPRQIFTSSAYGEGSRLYEVKKEGGTWSAEEKWHSRKLQIMHGSVAVFGDHVYGSSGDFGPAFLAGLDLTSGELTFRQRGFAKANVLRVGDKVLILDEDGTLAIGKPDAEGIEILSQASVLDGVSWTPPTLIGTTLLLRNRGELVALDLGTSAEDSRTTRLDETATQRDRAAFARSAGGLTLHVDRELLEQGAAYYVVPGEDAQVIVESNTELQRTSFVSQRVVGAMVTPFDIDEPDAIERPILAGSLRIPVHSLKGGSAPVRQLVFGAQGLDATAHPEIVVHFLEAKDPKLESRADGRTELELTARLRIEANGQELEIDAPVALLFQSSSMATMSRSVGDLAVLRSTLELDVTKLGIQLPPQLGVILSNTVSVDVFLGLSTVTPDKTLDPSISQQHFEEENRYLVLARDLGDDVAADAHFRQLMESSWDDPVRLARLAVSALTEPGIERPNLGLYHAAAQRANELESGKNALLLNTLARIQYQRGEVETAVETQREALELIDEQNPRFRSNLETNLERYEAALSD